MKLQKTRKLGLQYKVLLFVIVLISISCAVLGGVCYTKADKYLTSLSMNNTLATAKVIAANIDVDAQETLQPGDEESEVYQQMVTFLRSFISDSQLEYVYTMRPLNDKEVEFVIDADEEEPAAIGEPYEIYDEIAQAFEGNATIDSEFTSDEWGTVYTAYAPIFNQDGKVVAIVGADCSVNTIQDNMKDLTKVLLLTTVLVWIVAILAAILFSKRIARNLHEVNRKVIDVADSDGDLTRKVDVHSGDELELIADNINGFLEKLRLMISSVNQTIHAVTEVSAQVESEIKQESSQLE